MLYIERLEMKFLRPRTLLESMLPVMMASWVLGIGIFEYPLGRPHRVMSLCLSIINLVIYVALINFWEVPQAINDGDAPVHNTTISTSSARVLNLANFALMITAIYFGHMRAKKTMNCVHQIGRVDESLKKFMISDDYRTIFKSQIFQLVNGYILITGMTVATYFYTYIEIPSQFTNHVLFITLWYQTTFDFVIGYTFCEFIRCIGTRFQRINEHLIQAAFYDKKHVNSALLGSDQQKQFFSLMIHKIYGNSRSIEPTGTEWMTYSIRETRMIYRDLCSTARKLNSVFGVQILISITIAFGQTAAILFNLYYVSSLLGTTFPNLKITMLIFLTGIWLVFYVTKILYMVYTCSATSSEARQTGKLIEKLLISNLDKDTRDEVHSLTLQIMQNPLFFTANGFFVLDYPLICEMVATITTFLMIMIQMRNIYDPPQTGINSHSISSAMNSSG